jgi:tRNA modification GTPase
VTVIDTAGIRETDDPVEQEGVRRARARAADADLVLWLVDEPDEKNPGENGVPVWRVRNKIDLEAVRAGAVLPLAWLGSDRAAFEISASRGDGLLELRAALIRYAQDYFGSDSGGLIGRARQRQLLQEAVASLQCSLEVLGEGEELAAEHLRIAAHSLGRLLGRVDVEDILDVIFREFCIGK